MSALSPTLSTINNVESSINSNNIDEAAKQLQGHKRNLAIAKVAFTILFVAVGGAIALILPITWSLIAIPASALVIGLVAFKVLEIQNDKINSIESPISTFINKLNAPVTEEDWGLLQNWGCFKTRAFYCIGEGVELGSARQLLLESLEGNRDLQTAIASDGMSINEQNLSLRIPKEIVTALCSANRIIADDTNRKGEIAPEVLKRVRESFSNLPDQVDNNYYLESQISKMLSCCPNIHGAVIGHPLTQKIMNGISQLKKATSLHLTICIDTPSTSFPLNFAKVPTTLKTLHYDLEFSRNSSADNQQRWEEWIQLFKENHFPHIKRPCPHLQEVVVNSESFFREFKAKTYRMVFRRR